MQRLLLALKLEKVNDTETIVNKLIMLFLIMAITIPAYILYSDSPYSIIMDKNLCQGKVVSLYICSIILAFLCVFKLFKFKDKIDIELIKPVLPVIFFLIIVWVATALSPFMSQALWGQADFKEGAFTLTCYCIVFISTYLICRDELTFTKIITIIFAAAVLLYIFPLLKIFFPSIPSASINWGGTFLHRNYMASYYTLVFLPAVAGFICSKSRKTTAIFYFISCIFFSVFILNHTRSSWIGNTIGLILLIAFMRKSIRLKKIGTLLVSFFIIVVLINFLNNGLILSRFDSMINDVKVLTNNESNKALVGTTRLEIWRLAMQQVPKHFWFGIGPDMFEHSFPQDKYQENVNDKKYSIANAHDEYLNLLINIGVFGLLSYLWLIASIIKKFFKLYRKEKIDCNNSYLFLGVFCGWCAYLIQALFNNSVVPTSPTLWTIMGMLSAILYSSQVCRENINSNSGIL